MDILEALCDHLRQKFPDVDWTVFGPGSASRLPDVYHMYARLMGLMMPLGYITIIQDDNIITISLYGTNTALAEYAIDTRRIDMHDPQFLTKVRYIVNRFSDRERLAKTLESIRDNLRATDT